ncbi:MAG: hypothetical protein COY22_02385 [Candidatus Tagabacteria bacterium CG_4_10_14_0_2_um_filter_40_13]|uniref:Uncharacterized protein n=3 Tax=Candidatus Tagaibacteriota TaxID=1817918 RepID=A0A2M8G927_9BACT|nr:MAG: hypothetical protein COV90_01400 [Candidatus Tagabacteria bacterium CG11_big_fil_rev_8_21_14_0_20_41_11]PIU99798.1 MAG: hypothetical protein COS58_00070 [Candidatus Tagabacteria bacterium CG03_land_8_20_14_0_80_41_22]PIZ56012.1 MAG: hypothetical protein COY22_02385 [Candidatus Tagabacteria bacterium CG_4_10_14_0_2_um_filter_40_13]PJC69895.1 MAG: hypothetical protein CO014_01285 [Candidatus Tagabacteria bacterium CG_4_8_14_3_um_filter_41_8]
MEWFKQQMELWPRIITPEELNEELEKAARRGRRKGEDLVSKEETTKALEGKEATPIKICSRKKNLEEVKKIIRILSESEAKKI